MADSDLQSLQNVLDKALAERAKVFIDEEAKPQDYVDLLGALGAARSVTTQILELDRRAASLHRAATAGGSTATAVQSRLDEVAGHRTRLIEALRTLTREIER